MTLRATSFSRVLFLFSVWILVSCAITPPQDLGMLGQQVNGDCSVTVSSSPGSPQVQGASISLTAAGTCVSGTPEYKFYLRKPSGSWVLARDWAASATFLWDTTGTASGTFLIQAWARRQGQTLMYEGASPSVYFEITGGTGTCSIATLNTTAISPQMRGTNVTYTFSASCFTGSTPEYKLWHKLPSGTWLLAQDWTSSTSFAWNTSAEDLGTHTFQLWVRAQGGTSSQQGSSQQQRFLLVSSPPTCTNAIAGYSPLGPQPVGTSLFFSFSATCSTGATAEYKIWRKNSAGTWGLLRDWDTSSSFTWDTTTETVGNVVFQLWVRAHGSVASSQGVSSPVDIEFNQGNCTSLSSTQTAATDGKSISFQYASNCSGSGIAEYKLYHSDSSMSWKSAHDWQTSQSFAWDTTSEPDGIHTFQLRARVQGSLKDYQVVEVFTVQRRACYSGVVSTKNVGLCKGGVQYKMQGQQSWGVCLGETLPTAESCTPDTKDNDCDGLVDEPCPATCTFSSSKSIQMPSARSVHHARLLPNGKILIFGGWGTGRYSDFYSSMWIFDPATETFTTSNATITKRRHFASMVTKTGKVLIIGGYSEAVGWIQKIEEYDYLTDTAKQVATLNTVANVVLPVMLDDGKILLIAGENNDLLYKIIQKIDPHNNNTLTVMPNSLNNKIGSRNSLATLTPGGKVFVLSEYPELCDPADGKCTTTSIAPDSRGWLSGFYPMPNGKYFFLDPHLGMKIEFYDSSNNTISSGPAIPQVPTNMAGVFSTQLPDGSVVFAGGAEATSPGWVLPTSAHDKIYHYKPSSHTVELLSTRLSQARGRAHVYNRMTQSVYTNNRMYIFGGWTDNAWATKTVDILTFSCPTP